MRKKRISKILLAVIVATTVVFAGAPALAMAEDNTAIERADTAEESTNELSSDEVGNAEVPALPSKDENEAVILEAAPAMNETGKQEADTSIGVASVEPENGAVAETRMAEDTEVDDSTTHEVGDVLELDEGKFYKIYDAYDENGTKLDAISENSRVVFNNGGQRVGWLKYGNKFETTADTSYLWRASTFDQDQKTYVLTNQQALAANSIVADQVGNRLNGSNVEDFVVARKGNLSKGSPLRFIVMAVEDGDTYVKIEQAAYTDDDAGAISAGRFMSTEDVPITNNTDVTKERNYVTWIDDVSAEDRTKGWWVIEEVNTMPGSVEGSQLLLSTSAQKYHYRIPAITTTNKGDLILFSDYRYDSNSDIGINWDGWNGEDATGYKKIGHRIDQVMMRSSNNGENWSEPQNLTEEYSYEGVPNVKLANGYGDPAIVADRESDKVLVLSVGGSYGFQQEYPGVVSMLSHDGGMTFEEPVPLAGKTIGTSAISDVPTDLGLYELDNGGSEIYSMFVTSGRIMQSRYIKVGSSYRIYFAAPAKIRGEKEFKNFVFYSDDFGETWNVLPGIAIHGGDEAKVEELPNGDVVITTRMNGGRKVNIFNYDQEDHTYSTGSWGQQSLFKIEGSNAGVDGDLYILYAKNNETGDYGYLALQTLCQGQDRQDVRVYYKWLDETANTPEGFAKGFTSDHSFVLSKYYSAYSVMTLLGNGQIGFAWEEGNMWYNIVYKAIPLETITKNQFSLAFSSGIGSVNRPYVINTVEELHAYSSVYDNEGVHFELDGTAKTLEEAKQHVKEAEDAHTVAKEKLQEFNLDGRITAEEKGQIDDLNKKIILAKTLAEKALGAIGEEIEDKEDLVTRLEAVNEVNAEIYDHDSDKKDPILEPETRDQNAGGKDRTLQTESETDEGSKQQKIDAFQKRANSESPKTGDTTGILVVIGVLVFSLVIMIVVFIKKKRL